MSGVEKEKRGDDKSLAIPQSKPKLQQKKNKGRGGKNSTLRKRGRAEKKRQNKTSNGQENAPLKK